MKINTKLNKKTKIASLSLAKKTCSMGFTLIEALVAVTIVTISFAVVTGIFPLSLKVENSAKMRSKAIELAQSKIEEMTALSYEDINCDGNSVPCEEIEDSVLEDESFRRETSITYVSPPDFSSSETDTNIKKIEVTLYWNSSLGTGEKSTKISIFVSNR